MELGPIFRTMRRNKARFVLIVAEVALTLAIVANCVGLILDARAEMARQSGFDDAHLLSVRTTNFSQAFEEKEHFEAVAQADGDTLRAIPGVADASATFFLPWAGGGSSGEVKILDTEMEALRTQMYGADPHIFTTLGVEVAAGRGLEREDIIADPNPQGMTFNVVISRGLADLAFPEGGAVGQTFEAYGNYMRVVGVIDAFYNPYGWPIGDYAMFFAGGGAGASGSHFLVRAEPGRVDAVFGDIEEALLGNDDGRNVRVETILEVKERYHASRDLLVRSLNAVMLFLLAVTALGIVGLTAFSVTERRRTIGTRRALGATRADILRYFLLENWLVTTVGIALGVALAYALNVGLVTVATGAKLDFGVLLTGVMLLWGLGLAAALGPALRGARVAPAVATRNV